MLNGREKFKYSEKRGGRPSYVFFSDSLFVSLEIFPLWQIRLKLTLRTDLLLYREPHCQNKISLVIQRLYQGQVWVGVVWPRSGADDWEMKGFSQSSIKPKSAWRVGLLATRDH